LPNQLLANLILCFPLSKVVVFVLCRFKYLYSYS